MGVRARPRPLRPLAPLCLGLALIGCQPWSSLPGSARSATVLPSEREGRFLFTTGRLGFEVDARRGARITAFTLDGRNFLSGPEVNAEDHGSTFWTSPQSDWDWPPVAVLDSGPYTGGVRGGVLTLTSAPSTRLSVEVSKRFSVDPGDGSVSIEYSIKNLGPRPRGFAAWEITRVRVDGLTFFPSGDAEYGAGPFAALGGVRRIGAHTWFEFDPASPGPLDQELFADGRRGWLAHAEHGAVLVKRFADVPAAARAPGEAEIELYLHANPNPAARYAEIEQQGPYTTIAAQASASWRVTWYLKPLPAGARVAAGDRGLLDFVEALVR